MPWKTLDVPGLADALAAWMGAIGVPRAALLGNSFACQIIVDLAARHPQRVARTVLQGGPTTPPAERSWLWQFIRWRQNNRYNPPELCRPACAVEVARLLPRGQFVEIPGVAHTLVHTAPEQLAAVTRRFLSEGGNCRQMPPATG